uniref:Putative secreted protein n=1 Tax=Rhipicephalus microplus TaxID=6941 RepID=A0A6M2DA44_RHIMP
MTLGCSFVTLTLPHCTVYHSVVGACFLEGPSNANVVSTTYIYIHIIYIHSDICYQWIIVLSDSVEQHKMSPQIVFTRSCLLFC